MSNHQLIRLEFLPTEILYKIVEYLHGWQVKGLSCVNRRIRDVCLPSLFRKVSFEFSEDGFDGLAGLLQSHLCPFIVSFQYIVPQLLKNGKRFSGKILMVKANLRLEIRDYATFKAHILQ